MPKQKYMIMRDEAEESRKSSRKPRHIPDDANGLNVGEQDLLLLLLLLLRLLSHGRNLANQQVHQRLKVAIVQRRHQRAQRHARALANVDFGCVEQRQQNEPQQRLVLGLRGLERRSRGVKEESDGRACENGWTRAERPGRK
jgi:hypothetical protein